MATVYPESFKNSNKDNANYYIGESPNRVDAYDKVTGKGLFVNDYAKHVGKTLHMKVLRSPVAHGKIEKLDVSKAEAMPGVERVFTVERSPFHMDRLSEVVRFPEDNEVIWAGQPIAMVAADTIEKAEDALAAIELEITKLPHILTVDEALDPTPESIIDPAKGKGDGTVDASNPWAAIGRHETVETKFAGPNTSPNIVGNYVLEKGDIEKGLETADIILERDYSTGRRTHCQIEKAEAFCLYDDSNDSLTIISNGAGIHGVVKASVCGMFDMAESKVRTIQPYMGGSFGNRLTPYVEVLIAMMSLYLKKSVHYQYARDEMFTGGPAAWPVKTRVKYGATNDGRIIVQDYDAIEEVGAIRNNVSYTGRLSSSGAVCVYDIDNIRMDTCATVTNTVPVGPFRGLGCPESEFGMECLMNELADELNMSPVDIRIKNMIKNGGVTGYGEPVTSIGLEDCLKSVGEALDIDTPCEQDGTVWKRGKGIAVGGKQNTPLGRAESIVRYYSDGTVEVLISCDEQGMGAMTVMAQIAATTLELPLENITVIKGDSLVTPYDNYSASSRTTYTTGNAVKIACEEVKDKLQEEVARAYGIHKDKVEIHGTKAHLFGLTGQVVDIEPLFAGSTPFEQENWGLKKFSPVIGHGSFCPAPIKNWGPDGRTDRMWNWYQYAAGGVELAVNEETGEVKLLKIVVSADTGNPINPKMVEGQIEGGSLMAASFALQEEHLYNEDGLQYNTTMADYRISDIKQSPKVENYHSLINPDALPDGPFGAKGMAESVEIPIPAAIAQALYEAVGIRPTYFPMTAEYILNLIKEKKAGESKESVIRKK